METATSHDWDSRPPSIVGDEDAVLHNKNTQRLDLASEGDVILIVGAEHVRLRVDSQPLKCASKVFEAMFKADWNAGQELSKETPREFSLPEDDAEAMRIICCVIHHRNDLVPRYLEPKSILRIAIGVDKYDLKIAFQSAGSELLKPWCLEWDGLDDAGYLLAASFLFDSLDKFGVYTETLVLNHTQSYLDIMKDELVRQFLPFEICYILGERRTELQVDIYELLINGSKEFACKCGWGKIRKEELRGLLLEYPLKKMVASRISELIGKLQCIPAEKIGTRRDRRCPKENAWGSFRHNTKYSTAMSRKLHNIKARAQIYIGFAVNACNRGAWEEWE